MLEIILDHIRHYKLIVALIALIAVVVVIFGMVFGQSTQGKETTLVSSWTQSQGVKEESSSSSTVSKETDSTPDTITVDIKGAVKAPGVYDLILGSRVTDAVRKAGGLTEKADRRSVNLAQKLTDEAVVYVATEGEQSPPFSASPTENMTVTAATTGKGSVNLNTATVVELQTISGIGSKRAQDIIDYRDSSGGFKSVDELSKVSGIGEKTLDKLRGVVTVD